MSIGKSKFIKDAAKEMKKLGKIVNAQSAKRFGN